VTIATNHPVLLTSTGTKGAAVYKLQVQVQVNIAAVTCVEVESCSGGDTSLINACVLSGDQTSSAGGNFAAVTGTTVNANAEAVGSFGSGTYGKATQKINSARSLP